MIGSIYGEKGPSEGWGGPGRGGRPNKHTKGKWGKGFQFDKL